MSPVNAQTPETSVAHASAPVTCVVSAQTCPMRASADRAPLVFSLSEQSPPFCQKNSEHGAYSPSQSPLCKPFAIDSNPKGASQINLCMF